MDRVLSGCGGRKRKGGIGSDHHLVHLEPLSLVTHARLVVSCTCHFPSKSLRWWWSVWGVLFTEIEL